jgi:hypothetical protein
MGTTRTALINLRIDPRLKEALRVAADLEHRSISNMIEWLVRRHCEQAGIDMPQPAKGKP